ncbi:MAG: hypothetical protein IPJ04_07565 [Candidatus Eisenbacteria bacterium]|nr:hypothetical protein [Candidatus Eisenbacteria bacterium]
MPLRVRGGEGVALASIVQPLEWSATRDRFLAAVAARAPRGSYPRAMLGEMIYWTIVGVDGDSNDGLVDEYGRIETGMGRFSVEPFLRDRGRLVTWNDVAVTQSLRGGSCPMPSGVDRGRAAPDHDGVRDRCTRHAAVPCARYRLRNRGPEARRDTLYLALRPYQVNPPTQFLNTAGGYAPIRELSWNDRGGRERRPGRDESHAALGLRRGRLRAGRHHGLPSRGDAAAPGAHDGLRRPRLGRARLRARRARGRNRRSRRAVPAARSAARTGLAGRLRDGRRTPDEMQRAARRRWRTGRTASTIQLPDTDAVHALKAQLA